MIKAMYLQKQATKYRGLARSEESLDIRRQLFALASRCDELALVIARSPKPKPAPGKPTLVAVAPAAEPRQAPSVALPGRSRARLVHQLAD